MNHKFQLLLVLVTGISGTVTKDSIKSWSTLPTQVTLGLQNESNLVKTSPARIESLGLPSSRCDF
jgi:hypothetical protein